MNIKQYLRIVVVSVAVLKISCNYNGTINRLGQFLPIDKEEKFRSLTEHLSKLLESCEYRRIGALTDSSRFIYWTQELLNVATFVQIKHVNFNISLPVQKATHLRSHRPYKLDVFVVVTLSAISLEYMINRLRSSRWWNSSGLFIILDSNTAELGCRNAQSFLWSSWNMDLLSSTFFCLERTTGYAMYTFNPFTNEAPESWHEVKTTDNAPPSESWVLYSRKFYPDRTTCRDVNFEKTLKLNGYKLNAVGTVIPPLLDYEPERIGWKRYTGFDARIFRSINHKLNSTISATIHTRAQLGWIDGSGISHGIYSQIASGTYDYAINSQYVFNKIRTALTYPHIESGLTVLTRFHGFKTAEAKIVTFMNPVFVVCLSIMFTTTILILSITAKYTFPSACLEAIRIIVGTSTNRRVQRNSLRMYLMMIILLFLISNAVFQCNLSAILTSPIPKANIENLEQLIESNYTVYCFKGYRSVFHQSTLASRLVLLDHWNCTDRVMEDDNAACVADKYELVQFAVTHKLYMSGNIATLATAFVVRPDWPLRDRVNIILRRLFESGILVRWREETDNSVLHSWYVYRKWLQSCCIRKLSITDMAFIFAWLVLGLLVSTIVFFMEVCLYNGLICKGKVEKKIKWMNVNKGKQRVNELSYVS